VPCLRHGGAVSRGEWDRTVGVCEEVLGSAAAAHARAVSTGMLGLVHALRGRAKLARTLLLESNLTATRIELTAMELLSSWGLCILEHAAGAHGDAADRARQILTRLARTEERHYSVPILQWLATFFAGQDLGTGTLACAAALSGMAEATAQPEAIAALAHARGETLLPGEPRAAARELVTAADMFSAWISRSRRRRHSGAPPPRPSGPASGPVPGNCCTRPATPPPGSAPANCTKAARRRSGNWATGRGPGAPHAAPRPGSPAARST